MTNSELYQNDFDLLEGIRKRDNAAFEVLFKQHTSMLRSFLRNNGSDQNTINDIEQDTVIVFYEKLAQGSFLLNENTKLSTYLFAVGKNIFYSRSKKKAYSELTVDLPDTSDSFDYDLFVNEERLSTELSKSLSEIGIDCKSILTYYYYDNLSMREIASKMSDISEENLRKRKYKCIQKLKKLISI